MKVDAVVVGGGIMGCAAALRLAEGGMRVALAEARTIGSGASTANAGTLALQIKRVALMPYALRGLERWRALGDRVGYRRTGGVTVAFTPEEAALLAERGTLKREAGAPIEIVSGNRLRVLEPELSPAVLAASWCAEDGHSNASLTGHVYRQMLLEAGVTICEQSPVRAIDRDGDWRVDIGGEWLSAPRLLLATGAWLGPTAALAGVDLPVRFRVNTVTVTERAPPLIAGVVGHASGLLTLKQKSNGTVLIGGGWQGRGALDTAGSVVGATLTTNIQLAVHAVPALARTRALRSWTGYEAHTPDFYPLAGAVRGREGLFVLGAVRGGYTIGPYIGELIGDLMLGREPALPLFDPMRFEGEI